MLFFEADYEKQRRGSGGSGLPPAARVATLVWWQQTPFVVRSQSLSKELVPFVELSFCKALGGAVTSLEAMPLQGHNPS